MEELKSNSNKSRSAANNDMIAPDKKVEKIVAEKAQIKKKSEARKFTDIFISEDAHAVAKRLYDDIIVPSLKKIVDDFITNGVRMLLWGSDSTSNSKPASRISYSSYYERPVEAKRTYYSGSNSRNISCDDIVFSNLADARNVLDTMQDILSRYRAVSIVDLYEMADIPVTNYTLNRYGWTNLDGVMPVRVRDGYILNLPKAIPID